MGSDLQLRVLFVVPYTPDRIRTRPYNLIKNLVAAGHEVTVATLWGSEAELAAAVRLRNEVQDVLVERIRTARSFCNCTKALLSGDPLQSHYSWSPLLARRLARLVQTREFDVVHVEHLRGAQYALLLQEILGQNGRPAPPVVWDSVDCISRLLRSAARESHTARARLVARLELRRTERFEGWLASRIARVIVTSEDDKESLLRLGQESQPARNGGIDESVSERIAVISNGVDLEYFSRSREKPEPYRLVVSGKMSYHANVTAVVRFVRHVMPRIWAQLPQTRLWIVGKDPPGPIQKLGVPWYERNGRVRKESGDPRIEITGTVPDIRPYLQKSTVAVAPIQYGVGVQNKVLEAFSSGVPVVATPLAVRALDIRSGREALIAESDDELASSVVALLMKDEFRRDVAAAARRFVEERHDWTGVVKRLTGVYHSARHSQT